MHHRFALPCILALLVSPALCHAQNAEALARAEARKLAEQGDTAFAAGRCDQAIESWAAADQAFHAPSILVRIAQCQALLGKVVEASETLRKVANESIEADAPEAFFEARSRAQQELPKLLTRIAHVQVSIDAAGLPVNAETFIDKVKMPAGATRFPVNPGRRFIEVVAGDARYETTVQLRDGDEHRVKVVAEPDDASPLFTQRRIGFVVGGAGVLAAGLGVWLGLRATSLAGKLDEGCGPDRTQCPPEWSGNIDDLKQRALLADVALASGAVLLAGGALLVFTDSSKESQGPHIRLVPAGAGAALIGRF